jgi:hypothetical protein
VGDEGVEGLNDVSDGLVALIRVIGEDRNLHAWFRHLVALPQNLRVSEIGRLVAEMHANGEDRQTVEAFSTLSDLATCRVVAGVLLERYGVRVFET